MCILVVDAQGSTSTLPASVFMCVNLGPWPLMHPAWMNRRPLLEPHAVRRFKTNEMQQKLELVFFLLLPRSSPDVSSPPQACGDPKAKPSYLVDKNLESAVKFIVRKFPAVETRNNNVSVPAACLESRCERPSQIFWQKLL